MNGSESNITSSCEPSGKQTPVAHWLTCGFFHPVRKRNDWGWAQKKIEVSTIWIGGLRILGKLARAWLMKKWILRTIMFATCCCERVWAIGNGLPPSRPLATLVENMPQCSQNHFVLSHLLLTRMETTKTLVGTVAVDWFVQSQQVDDLEKHWLDRALQN